ncbi:hypothetical protein [Bacteroides sp. An322]|uniref:hypothetical protein n=1 Tax=Bacteroides sp. An322 TaxID=1965632 RepID=UPI000B38F7CF|nr:hypothetical protein [Bacteroides sp. An322]OUO23107.1 hypothetical protein B5F91_03140 [Bacteroides sp. An322]
MAVPVELEIFMRDLTKAGLQSVGKNVEGVESQTRRLIAALEQVRTEQLNQLNAAKKTGQSYTTEAANVQALTGQINGLKAGLKELQKEQAAAGATKIDIDTEAVERKTNNLRMQFSQVARELPSLAMGPQMFILAISNNLPMLADAIADVRKQNELLNASGKKAVPVWRQLLGACWSWQTALIAAISVGIMFGKDIANWVKGLFNGKKAFDGLKKAQEDYNKEMLAQQQHAQTEAVTLKLLYDAATDAAGGMKERTDAVRELKKEYPDYFKNLTDEEILTGKAADSYMRLTESIMASARAQAARNSIVEQQGKVLENEQKINEAYTRLSEAENKLKEVRLFFKKQEEEGFGTATAKLASENAVIKAETQVRKIEKEIAGYRKAIYQANKVSKELEKDINVSDLVFDPKGTSGGTPTGSGNTPSGEKDYASRLAEARLRAEQETERLRIQIQQEGFDRRRALAKQEYEEVLAAIEKQQKDTVAEMDKAKAEGSVIPQAQYDSVNEEADRMRVTAREKLNLQLQQIDKDYNKQAAQDLIDYNKQYGTYAEKRLAIAQDYARKIAKAQTDGEKQALAQEYKKETANLDFDRFKETIDWEKIFGDLDRISTDTLESLREKLKAYLEGIGDDISPESFAEVMDAFQAIDEQLADRSPFEALKQGYEDYRTATEEVREAEQLLQDTQRTGFAVIEEYDEATGKLTAKLITQAEAEERLRNAQDKRNDAQKSLSQAANSIGKKGQQVVNAGNDLLDMLTSLGVSVPESIQGVLQGLGTITSSLESIDFTKPFSILTGITGTLKGVGQIIGSLFGLGSDSTERYEKLKESLEAMNEIYDKILSKEKEMITFGGGFASIDSANEAMYSLNKQMENYRQLAEAAGKAGSGMFKHSYAHRSNEAIGAGGFAQISSLLGKNIQAVQDLYTLSGDELYEIMSKLPELWNGINGNIRQYLEQLVEAKDEASEIIGMLDEALTGMSADSFYNDFISQVSDMSVTWEDMCGSFEDRLRESIIAGLVSSEYKQRIQDLYKQWSQAAESDNRITDKEAEQLRNEYMQIVQDLMKQRDEMADAFGWESETSGSSQSPTTGALTTMSQDSISRFEGIGRSMQTHLINIDKSVADLRASNQLSNETLATIATHTAHIVLIHELMEEIKVNGIKVQ